MSFETVKWIFGIIIMPIVGLIGAVLAGSGYWSYKSRKEDAKQKVKTDEDRKNDAIANMVKGLGHDKIMHLGGKYILRGWISHDEYENLHEYIYLPYQELGGNGSAKRIMEKVKDLPSSPPEEAKKEKQ